MYVLKIESDRPLPTEVIKQDSGLSPFLPESLNPPITLQYSLTLNAIQFSNSSQYDIFF